MPLPAAPRGIRSARGLDASFTSPGLVFSKPGLVFSKPGLVSPKPGLVSPKPGLVSPVSRVKNPECQVVPAAHAVACEGLKKAW